MLSRPFSSFLRCSQSLITASAESARGIAEHVRMAHDELVVDRPGDIGERERAVLAGERGVEADLEQQIAELLFEMVVALAGLRIEMLQRVEHLVRLLEQVTGQRLMRLLAIPRASFAQHVDELVEPRHLGRDGRRDRLDVQRRSGDRARTERSSSARSTAKMRSCGRAESLQHHDGRTVEVEARA